MSVPERTNPAFDRLLAEAVPALLAGTHRQDEPPVDGGRWPVSVVCIPDEQARATLARVMHEALTHAGPGHFQTGRPDASHVTVRALEPYREAASPHDPITDAWVAALDEVRRDSPPIRLRLTGVTLSSSAVLVQAEPVGDEPWELMRGLRAALGPLAWFEDEWLQRDIWYVSVLHFAAPIRDAPGLIDWAKARRSSLGNTIVLDAMTLVRFRYCAFGGERHMAMKRWHDVDLTAGRVAHDVESQYLLVVDPVHGHELVDLPHPPEDATCFAELVSVLGQDRLVEPAGPPLRAAGHLLHRVRGPVAGPTSRVPDVLAPLVSAALDQERGGPVPAARAAWCRGGWAEQTAVWVEEVLARRGAHRTGRSTVVKSWGLSQVERVPSSEGIRYLKASSALFAHEPATTAWLAGLAPAVVPGVLAVDGERACMLMDALPPAKPALTTTQERVATCTAMAQVQLAVAGRCDEFRATGAPERGLASTALELAEMLRTVISGGQLDGRRRRELDNGVTRALGLLDELAACGLPDALVHGDLHPANVVVAAEGAVVFDWSDACVGHPLLDLVHLCTDRPRTGPTELDWDTPWVQAYLEPWREGFPAATLRRALELADVADLAFQGVTYQRIQDSLEPDARQDPAGVTLRALDAVVDNLPGR